MPVRAPRLWPNRKNARRSGFLFKRCARSWRPSSRDCNGDLSSAANHTNQRKALVPDVVSEIFVSFRVFGGPKKASASRDQSRDRAINFATIWPEVSELLRDQSNDHSLRLPPFGSRSQCDGAFFERDYRSGGAVFDIELAQNVFDVLADGASACAENDADVLVAFAL